MKKKVVAISMLAIMMVLVFSGCVPGDGSANADNLAGFFLGIWHGWIAPISLIIGLFNKSIHIYESMNTGWWYDFGFYIAIISGFGGVSLFREKGRRRKNNK